jgi:hypothetical protein
MRARTASTESVTGVPVCSARATGEALDLGVPLHQRTAPGIDVPGADVPRAALPVDDGDDAAVGEDGDDELGEPTEGGPGVQLSRQLGAHLGEQGGAGAGQTGGHLRVPSVGDVEDVDGEAVGTGPDPDLEPAHAGAGERRLEGLRLAGRHRRPADGLEHRSPHPGEGVPERRPDELVARPAHEPLGLGVHVPEAPPGVEEAEGGRHRLQEPDEAFPGVPPGGRCLQGGEIGVLHAAPPTTGRRYGRR